jgi:hypothetical protein
MTRKIVRLAGALLIAFPLILVACGSSGSSVPAASPTWNAPESSQTTVLKEPDYTGGRFHTILVVGIIAAKSVRENLENKLVDMFKEREVGAAASYQVLPEGEDIDRELVKKYIADTGIDAVLVIRVKALGTETSQPIKTNANTPPPGPREDALPRSDFYGHYTLSYDAVRASDYPTSDRFVELETKLFEAKEGKEVWSATRKSENPNSTTDVIKQLGTLIITELSKENLI